MNRLVPRENYNELEEKYNALQQSATVLQLEKQEYIHELQRVRASNVELTQTNVLLESATNDTQQQAHYLSRQLTEHTHVLEDESVKNKRLQQTIATQRQLITTLQQENKVLQQSNLHYRAQMEALNNRYRRLEAQNAANVEQSRLRIETLVSEIIHYQQRIQYTKSPSDDDEKSSTTRRLPGNPLLQREPTLDLRLTGLHHMLSTDSMQSVSRASSVRSSVYQPLTFSRGSFSQNVRVRANSTYNPHPLMTLRQSEEFDIDTKNIRPRSTTMDRRQHFDETLDAQLVNNRSNSTNAGLQFTDAVLSDEDEDEYSPDASPLDFRSGSLRKSFLDTSEQGLTVVVSQGQGFPNTAGNNDGFAQQRFQALQDKLFQQENEMIEMRDAFGRQQTASETQLQSANNLTEALTEQNAGLKTENASLKQQMGEKDGIIERCTKQTTEMSERFETQSMRMQEQWEAEKQQIYQEFDGEKSEMMGYYNGRMQDMDLRYNTLEHQYIDIEQEIDAKNRIIKQLELRNKELEVMTEAPQQSSCYSITEWFKF